MLLNMQANSRGPWEAASLGAEMYVLEGPGSALGLCEYILLLDC